MGLTSYVMNTGVGLLELIDTVERRPSKMQEKVLRKLLYKARRTAFGKHFRFSNMLLTYDMVAEFQKQVPIHDYNKIFNDWWSRSLEGEADVAWPGTVNYFALSSGTSGASSKYIPVTTDIQQSMRKAAFNVFAAARKFNIQDEVLLKNWLTIGGSATLKKHNSSWVGDLSGINSLKPPFWVKNFRKPGIEVARLENWEDRTDAIMKHAHEWDVSSLVGIPSWVQLTLEKIIDYHGINNIHEIWPNLSLFVTGGINIEPYLHSFEKLLGKPIDYLDTYLASEGFLAYQSTPGDSSMKLLLNEGIFFEFIPFDEHNFDENGQVKTGVSPLTINEVEKGVDYALLISTSAGAWRYLIGDVVRFSDVEAYKIHITGRTSQFLSVCGEHLSVDNLNHAITKVNNQYNFDFSEFSVGAVPKEGHFHHEWFIGSDQAYDEKLIASLIDDELKQLNDDYKAERGAMLRPPKVNLIPPHLFLEWKRQKGKLNGQSKVPRVLKGDRLEAWKEFVTQKSSC